MPINKLLFDLLKDHAEGKRVQCVSCNHDLDIHLEFQFGMAVGTQDYRLLEAFYASYDGQICTWKDAENIVEFYPFLVILAAVQEERGIGVWLPYWHIVLDQNGQRRETKYGQWAPFMDIDLFQDLVARARAKGYHI
ncbi:MAG: hypothetical protein ACPLPT_10370 [Moorellales bacterium]